MDLSTFVNKTSGYVEYLKPKECLQILPAGIYRGRVLFSGIAAGIIRMRVLFEGGSYMRQYGILCFVLDCSKSLQIDTEALTIMYYMQCEVRRFYRATSSRI